MSASYILENSPPVFTSASLISLRIAQWMVGRDEVLQTAHGENPFGKGVCSAH
jgi:hypothetical protein